MKVRKCIEPYLIKHGEELKEWMNSKPYYKGDFMNVYVIVGNYDNIEAVMSTEEKAKLYCAVHHGCEYEPYEVDEFELGAEFVEKYKVYDVNINIAFEVTKVRFTGERYDYKNGVHLESVPSCFSFTCKETYYCELYVPESENRDVLELAKEQMQKEKERILGGAE